MKPEFLNRIDEIVVFSPLSGSDLALIAGLIVDKIITRASLEHAMQLTVTSDLVDKIVREGSTSADEFGARPMRRAAQRFVEDSLSDAIIQGFLKRGDAATISLAPPHLDGKDRVVIVSSDGNRFEVEIEESGGIGSVPSSIPKRISGINGPKAASPNEAVTRTEPTK
jgi:ATP-dependent Clp protease ATP-binding subunit ClpC